MKREEIYNKYNGLCAYTGKPLGNDWQIDHMISKSSFFYLKLKLSDINNIDNLMPTLRIVNHYKRAYHLEEFRAYMMTFHIRLAKLPKKTNVLRTQKRKEYMQKVAEAFGITTEKPFNGVFYFEKIMKNEQN